MGRKVLKFRMATAENRSGLRRPGDQPEEDPTLSFEEIFRTHHKSVLHFFLKKGFPREESRDLAQETFLRVYKNIETFRSESRIETWLFTIATNLYRNELRNRAALKRDAHEVSLDAHDEDGYDGGEGMALADASCPDPLDCLVQKEGNLKLREALRDLPPQMRRVVLLRVDGDLKYREIAEVLQISIETVKAHLYQARQQLKDRLSNHFKADDFHDG
jgi:RNA polymerase sigma-70 factor (ECF subfamily)